MKISNVIQIRILAYFIITIAILSLLSIPFQETVVSQSAYILLVVFLFICLINLKATFVECSGACLAVRKIHPLSKKRFIRPLLELPLSSLTEFSITENILSDCLKIKIRSSAHSKSFRISLVLFSKKQIVGFKNSVNVIHH